MMEKGILQFGGCVDQQYASIGLMIYQRSAYVFRLHDQTLTGIETAGIWINRDCRLDLAPLKRAHGTHQPSKNLVCALAMSRFLLVQYSLDDTAIPCLSQYGQFEVISA